MLRVSNDPMPWVSFQFFCQFFTRKGPWVCKGIERVEFVRAIGDSQSQLNLGHKVPTQYDSIYLFYRRLLTEHTMEISQIFSDKKHPNIKSIKTQPLHCSALQATAELQEQVREVKLRLEPEYKHKMMSMDRVLTHTTRQVYIQNYLCIEG